MSARKKFFAPSIVAVLFLGLLLPQVAIRTTKAAGAKTAKTTPYVISYFGSKPSDNAAAVQAVLNAGGTITSNLPEINLIMANSSVAGFDANLPGANQNIEYAVADQVIQWLDPSEMASAENVVAGPSGLPPAQAAGSPFGASFLPVQWNIKNTRTNQAWNVTQGSNTVHVAVLDTGSDPSHQDLAGKIDPTFSISFVTEPSGCAINAGTCPGCPLWQDRNFHGTHTSSTVSSNNIGTAGVAPNIVLRAIKVLDCTGSGSFGAVINGIIFAALTGNDVISMSLGAILSTNQINLPGVSQLLGAIQKAIFFAEKTMGVLVVSAAGNSGLDLTPGKSKSLDIPAQLGGMSIGATTITDQAATFSDFGAGAVTLWAPGGGFPVAPNPANSFNVFVLAPCDSHSANPGLAVCADGHHYVFAAGTSMATPHVSGAAALVASNLPPGVPKNSAAAVQFITNKLVNTGDPIIIQEPGPFGGPVSSVVKRLDTYHAVQ
jgi:subtilisin family serine protease